MNKVTKVNCEGEDYGFVAGGALKGVSGASASEYIKAVVLPEGADLVEGCLLLVTFVNGNTAGFYGTKTIYSSNGTTFYYDQAMTDPVTLPPEGCYIITPASENEYLYQAFPVLSVNGVEAPFCDSKGHPYGGAAWSAGDEVTMLYMGDKFVAILVTINQVVAGVGIPPTSDAVYNAIADEANSRDDAIAANNTAKGLVSSKTDNAIARWDGTEGKLQNSGVIVDDDNDTTTDGFIQAKGYRKDWTQLDLSALDESKWFPVTFSLSTNDWTEVVCYVSLDSGTKPSWSTHSNGFTCHLHLLAMGSGWGTTSGQTLVLDRQSGFSGGENPCGWSQMTNSSTGVLWLRGGGKYRVWNNKKSPFTIRTSAYTVDEQTVEPKTSNTWTFTKAQMYGNIEGIATQADYTRGTAYCTTAAGTAAKVALMRGYVLRAGNCFPITFTESNTATSMTLNVNGTGSKSVYLNGKAVSSSNKTLNSGTYLCLYDGSVYHIGFSGASTAGAYGGLLKADKWSMGTSSGYIKFSNGLLIQWGYVVKNTSQDGTETIKYPIGYTQIPALNATWIKSGGYTRMNIKSISELQAVIRNTDGTTNGYTWMSIGY